MEKVFFMRFGFTKSGVFVNDEILDSEEKCFQLKSILKRNDLNVSNRRVKG
jgi:hypothetical protein